MHYNTSGARGYFVVAVVPTSRSLASSEKMSQDLIAGMRCCCFFRIVLMHDTVPYLRRSFFRATEILRLPTNTEWYCAV
jgi:hypothetical protein